jgi:hypothetical protein
MEPSVIAKLEEMKGLTANNHKKFREAIAQANPPCLPYIGLSLFHFSCFCFFVDSLALFVGLAEQEST